MQPNYRILLTAASLCAGLLSTTADAALQTRLGGQGVYDTDLNISWLTNANLAASNTFGLATGADLGQFTTNYGFYNFSPNGFDPTYYSNTSPSTINADGTMNFGGAQKWIAAMNAANYLGYNDWRLPNAGDMPMSTFSSCPSCIDPVSINTNRGEMGHLFSSELGNQSVLDAYGNWQWQSSFGLANVGSLNNLTSSSYWTGSTYMTNQGAFPTYMDTTTSAVTFDFSQGIQYASSLTGASYAMAVRGGDSALAAPASVPVPAAAWLLGSGLLGLMGVARRKAA